MRDNFVPVATNNTEFLSSVLIDKLITERGMHRPTVALSLNYKSAQGHTSVAEQALTFDPVNIFGYQSTEAILELEDQNFIILYETFTGDKTIFFLKLIGDPQWAIDFKKKNEYKQDHKTVVRWAFMDGNHISKMEFEIDEPLPIYDEYYPYIKGGVDSFFNEYFNSTPAILILIGEPGTGKTSLIRHLLWERKLKATVTFDDRVMAEESYFVEYAADKKTDMMIVEDADLLLSSRQSDQNRLMAKLLNISDGLIRLDKKKMIFSTNLTNVNKIDPALVRSGRCFGVLQFRMLTNAEAKIAAEKAGRELISDKKELPLAEVFNTSHAKKADHGDSFKLLRMR